MTDWQTWIVEPRDPLIVRDGRPFEPSPGARAASLPFPFPSTTTGGARHRAGLDVHGSFDGNQIATVQALPVRGPLLVQLDNHTQDAISEWFVPAPADALVLQAEDTANGSAALLKRLVPLALPSDCATDLDASLALVGQVAPVRRTKPLASAPRFWCWQQLEAWLASDSLLEQQLPLAQLAALGLSELPSESRIHVGIQRTTQTAQEGVLFQTSGREFTGYERQRLALALFVQGSFAHFDGGLAPLAGERRLVSWRKSKRPWPACPASVRQAIRQQRACRIVLLTPAFFKEGYRPTFQPRADILPTLQALAVQRAQVVSGWDLAANERKGGPKPTRRLVPAGSVLFVRLPEPQEVSDDAIDAWIDELWMSCISDDRQSCLDGFGLAVLGVWSGKINTLGGEYGA